MCSAGVVLPRAAAVDGWDKRTMLTFSQAVEIPGTVLPAGTYLFQLADSPASRHVVQVFDQDALRAIGKRNLALNSAAVRVARRLAESEDATARWIGKDALRELTSPALTTRLEA